MTTILAVAWHISWFNIEWGGFQKLSKIFFKRKGYVEERAQIRQLRKPLPREEKKKSITE